MSINRLHYFLITLLWVSATNLPAHDITPVGKKFHSKDTITIASEPDYPPYCFVDENGKPAGFSIDIFNAAAKAAGLKVKIRTGIWSMIKQDLAEGRIDALPLVGRTPEREKLYDFTLSYLSLHGAVFVRKGTEDIHSLGDLKEKSVVVMEGDNAEEFIRRENISTHVVTTHTFEEAFIALANGNHDAVITQRILGIELLQALGIDNVEPLDFHLPEFRQDFCFAVQKGDTLLLSRLNEGLSIIIANNTFEHIRNQWFGPRIKEKIAFKDILRILMFTIIPLIIIIGLIAIFVLRKEVKRQTRDLHKEITDRKQAEEELRKLKEDLEITVAERTTQLQEKIKKLDRSETALLYMVEDLNLVTVELQEERRKLLASNQELEAFTYSVSHDLRAPLRAIDGYSNFLLEDYADRLDKEGKRFIRVIRDNATKMDRLISDLLNLSRVSRSDMNLTQVNMSDIALSMYHEMATEEEKKTFDFSVKPMPPSICDIALIKQVWQNLIGNSLKYSSRSGIKKIEIEATEQEEETVFCIKDSGAGFNDHYAGKLFDVFQRLHIQDEFPGTGVGLAIVKRIVHRHGGRVWGTGKADQGATFCFTLPRKPIG